VADLSADSYKRSEIAGGYSGWLADAEPLSLVKRVASVARGGRSRPGTAGFAGKRSVCSIQWLYASMVGPTGGSLV